MPKPPPLGLWAASRLRGIADRLEPAQRGFPGRAPAPLIRFGGKWWHRDEVTLAPLAKDPPTDVQAAPDTPA
jgi:hypothetical protein